MSTNYSNSKNLDLALSNPVVLRCVDIIADLFSQTKFYIEGKETDALLDKLNNPNAFQSKQDFLKEFIWLKYIYGSVYQHLNFPNGFKRIEDLDSVVNLNTSLFENQNNKASKLDLRKEYVENSKNYTLKYDEFQNGILTPIEIKNIVPFYDMVNGLDNSFLMSSPNRILSVKKAIENINISLDAENIVLNTNGRELITNETQGQAVTKSINPAEKEQAERKFQNNYGLSMFKNRTLITNSKLSYQSMHIRLADLGLKESYEKNASIIRDVFGIPNEVYNTYQTGATFENQEKAFVNFIQNVLQAEIDDFCNTYTTRFEYDKTPLKGNLEHLSIMQVIESDKADKALKISTAIRNMVQSGMSVEDASATIEMIGVNLSNEKE